MTTHTHQTHRVYTREKWEDDWTEQEGMYCPTATASTSPEVGSATLVRAYGRVMVAGKTAFVDKDPLDINLHYVKVEIDQPTQTNEEDEEEEQEPRKWYGVVVDTEEGRGGRHNGQTTGAQAFQCRGLEYLLQREIIDSSWVQTADDEIEIQRAIAFNLGEGLDSSIFRRGNMELEGAKGAAVFAESLDDATEWNGIEIINYLLIYHPPRNIANEDKLGWVLADGVSRELLSVYKPALHVHGMSIKQILDAICDRRRLLGWYISVEGEDETPTINVFSFNLNVVSIPSGGDLQPNENLINWYFDDDQLVQVGRYTRDATSKFDRVIARGERLGGCFTISNATTTLEKDWATDLQTAYNAGASGAAGYAALDDYEKENANQLYRATDKFKKVYRYFRIPTDWDGNVDSQSACPDPDDVTAIEVAKFWLPGMRLLPHLPLLSEHTYTTVSLNPSDETLEGSKAEYLRPFGIAKDDTKYYYIDRMTAGKLADEIMTAGGRDWSCHVRMQDEGFGIIVDVHGWPQHALAKDDFTATDSVDSAGYPADLDWKDFKFTVFAEFDQHVEAIQPEEPLDTEADVVRELVINVPRARLDWVADGTVVGVDNEGALQTSEGGYVRDDRPLLKDIAKAAFQWYSEERIAIEVTQHSLTTDKGLGYLIRQIGKQGSSDRIDVNTCITQMQFNIAAGSITYRTQFAELDPRAFAASGRGLAWG